MEQLLTEERLGELISAHHSQPGDVIWRKEGLPWYNVPSQNADRDAWLEDRFDPTQVQDWAEVLADRRRRGMVSQRLRIVSETITDDEAMSLNAALPIIATSQEVRVLHRGEHLVPDLVDHDYFVIRPAAGGVLVVAMRYTQDAAFQGAYIVPDDQHELYLREQELGWAGAEPYASWWARHPELHCRHAAA